MNNIKYLKFSIPMQLFIQALVTIKFIKNELTAMMIHMKNTLITNLTMMSSCRFYDVAF
jgi:hypothetical protein